MILDVFAYYDGPLIYTYVKDWKTRLCMRGDVFGKREVTEMDIEISSEVAFQLRTGLVSLASVMRNHVEESLLPDEEELEEKRDSKEKIFKAIADECSFLFGKDAIDAISKRWYEMGYPAPSYCSVTKKFFERSEVEEVVTVEGKDGCFWEVTYSTNELVAQRADAR